MFRRKTKPNKTPNKTTVTVRDNSLESELRQFRLHSLAERGVAACEVPGLPKQGCREVLCEASTSQIYYEFDYC